MSAVLLPMTPDHIPACADIMASARLWRDYGVTRENAVSLFYMGLDQPGQILQTVTLDDVVIGFTWHNRHGAFYHGGYLRLLGLHEAYRGKGIGQQVMAAVEDDVRPHSAHLFLLAAHTNLAAQRFYERLGYQSVGRLPDFVITGVTELIYWKQLK